MSKIIDAVTNLRKIVTTSTHLHSLRFFKPVKAYMNDKILKENPSVWVEDTEGKNVIWTMHLGDYDPWLIFEKPSLFLWTNQPVPLIGHSPASSPLHVEWGSLLGRTSRYMLPCPNGPKRIEEWLISSAASPLCTLNRNSYQKILCPAFQWRK